ncbi:MAG: acetate--CoA ligase family protein, partial [Acidimicrobiales bacterium]
EKELSNLELELERAAKRGDRSAVIYGSAVDPTSPTATAELRARLAETAQRAGMALCGGGCMGFLNASYGLRAIGYLEPCPLPRGPVALVTHSGSAFSALLRADRRLGFTLAVSSGQELVTTAAAYVEYALDLPETRVVALLLETMRLPDDLRRALARCAAQQVPVVALTVGRSATGRAMVAAHSGALAGDDGAWEALFAAYGVVRVGDLDEMCDTLELFATGRRAPHSRPGSGIASVHDSGAERALAVDLAEELGLDFAKIDDETTERLGQLLDPGLEAANPLDVWGTGASSEELFAGCLVTLAGDPSVDAVALAVDLVPELDGDESYRDALLQAFEATELPVCLVSNLSSALDREAARRLRSAGIPILEGTRSGLAALAHLLEWRDFSERASSPPPVLDEERRSKWAGRILARSSLSAVEAFALLADYGLASPGSRAASSRGQAIDAATSLGYPVVLKSDAPGLAHKTDVGGVVLELGSPEEVGAAYDEIANRLGRAVILAATAEPGVELIVGIVRDVSLGPLVVLGAGGILVDVLQDRAVALPPVDEAAAARLLGRLSVKELLDKPRGGEKADIGSIERAVVAMSQIALELGDIVEALEINPLRCTPRGCVALDVLVEVPPPTAH